MTTDLVEKSLLACSQCLSTLKSPVMLPCGENICKHHVITDELSNNDDDNIINNEYYCCSCNQGHPMPKGGFVINKVLQRILDTKFHYGLKFGNEYESIIGILEKVERALDKYHQLKRDPDFKIDNEIGALKRRIDVNREELKLCIDQRAENLIEQVVGYEIECKRNVEVALKPLEASAIGLEADLKQAKDGLFKMENEIMNYFVCHTTWKTMSERMAMLMEKRLAQFEIQLDQARNEIFLGKLAEYRREKQLNIFIGENSLRYIILF